MINAIFRPIDKWPATKTEPGRRRSSNFKATYSATLDLLESELEHLRATDIVIQCEAERQQIRNDGWLRSDAKIFGPAVIVSFTAREKTYSYPCDRFTNWQANLRAIALSLEALRAVDRYGVTSSGEQYEGFLRLAAPDPASERNAAVTVLAELSGMFLSGAPTDEVIDDAYYSAARRAHPDRGGKAEDWARLQAAMTILRPKKGSANA